MKFLSVFLLLGYRLSAQVEAGSIILDFASNQSDITSTERIPGDTIIHEVNFSWEIIENPDGSKSFLFMANACSISLGPIETINSLVTNCHPISESAAEDIGAIDQAEKEFYSIAPNAIHNLPVYSPLPFVRGAHPGLTVVQPAAPVDPQMIMFDGLSYNIVEFDLTTFAMTSSVTLPPQARAFGVRPTATGPANEVWTAHGGTVNEISICDLGAQSVLATIPTPSLDPNNTVPVGVVFTSSGLNALYAVSYYTPDSAGNNGTLLVFDAVGRTLTSTLLLKYAPTSVLMAPDGLTAYLIQNSNSGAVVSYYDMLSGTADLTASLEPPGVSTGYSGIGSVFIHPDGTRLFWNVGPNLSVFNLTTRQVTNSFSSGLATGSAVLIRMSQDGSSMWFNSALGKVVILDTLNGNILGTYQGSPNGAVYPGPAN